MGEDGKTTVIPLNHWLMAYMRGWEHGFRDTLSDDAIDYQIRDRLSFMRFLGVHLEDRTRRQDDLDVP
jgi:hypothetical protein